MQFLLALHQAAPHLDQQAIDGLKAQLPPPEPVKPEDPSQTYSKTQAAERKAKSLLDKLIESEKKAFQWYRERQKATEEAAYQLARAQSEAEAALAALQEARGTEVTQAPPSDATPSSIQLYPSPGK